MGYCIEMTESTIAITKENSIKMMDMLSQYIEDNKPNWAWVDTNSLYKYCKSHNFNEVMSELRYETYFNDGNDVYEIDYFSGEKLGDEFNIFPILAPYISDGYIEMVGEDGDKWRWVFKDDKCNAKFPTVSWD